jgi:hypothetical protein
VLMGFAESDHGAQSGVAGFRGGWRVATSRSTLAGRQPSREPNSETPTPASPPQRIGHLCCAWPTPRGGTPSISLIPPKALVVPPRQRRRPFRLRSWISVWKWEVFFCPLRFPTTSARRHLEKSRRKKSCAHVRGFADFYQRFFFGETPSQKTRGLHDLVIAGHCIAGIRGRCMVVRVGIHVFSFLSNQVSKTSIRSPSCGDPAYFGHSSVSGMAMR